MLAAHRLPLDIDDEELGLAVTVLWCARAAPTRHRNLAMVDRWSTWCRAAKLPVPTLPAH
jgi:hypothetical protein